MAEDFEIITGGELMKRRKGVIPRYENLEPMKVPEPLRFLISLAEKWGVADDVAREELLETMPRAELDRIAAELQKVKTRLDEWLAGPEADSELPSREYVAFSALRMLAMGV